MTTLRFSSASNVLTLIAILMLTSTVFAETVVYSLQGRPDGVEPFAGLTAGKHGLLYGVTAEGGAAGAGAVFQLTLPADSGGAWTETVIYSFKIQPDCAGPEAGLVFDEAGNLYGTSATGANEAGCVFELIPPTQPGGSWTESVIYTFMSCAHCPHAPLGLTLGWHGSLYGTTEFGGTIADGAVFRLSKSSGTWVLDVIYSLGQDASDGKEPRAGLFADKAGNLYGTTNDGGDADCGTVFELSPPITPGVGWTESVLYRFTGAEGDGSAPEAPLVLDPAGNLYGTTVGGGEHENGTIFELSPNEGGGWTETILYAFIGGSDGSGPFSGLVLDGAGNLYGEAYSGGRIAKLCPYGCGTAFELSPPSVAGGAWTETTLHEFRTGYETTIDGIGPNGGLVFGLSGSLYGTTRAGGATVNEFGFNGYGAIFSVHP